MNILEETTMKEFIPYYFLQISLKILEYVLVNGIFY